MLPDKPNDKVERHSEESPPLRTVLPHEPIPSERPGRILLQGAYTPKKAATPSVGKDKKSEDDDGTDESNDKNTASSSLLTDFWSAESLETEVVRRLNSVVSSSSLPDDSSIVDPFTGATVLDRAPPFTKVIVTCESSDLAYRLAAVLRKQNIRPSSILGSEETADHTAAAAATAVAVVYGTRPFQLSLLTAQPVPALDRAWNRSNPPKFRRLLPKPGEDPAELEAERTQTRFVFVSNVLRTEHEHAESEGEGHGSATCWGDPHCVAQAVRDVVTPYDTSGMGAEVFVSHNKLRHCHVGMRSPADAQRLLEGLQGTVVTLSVTDPITGARHSTASGRLFLDYAAITNRSAAKAKARDEGRELEKGEPPSSECTSLTDHVVVPGLHVVPDFVSADEEAALLAVLTGPHAPWAPLQDAPTAGRAVRRKVQHYGYVFDYATADVLRDRAATAAADCPPLPAIPSSDNGIIDLESTTQRALENGDGWTALACVVERTRRHQFNEEGSNLRVFSHLNQLTVNLYRPGEGIGSHVDTPSAFGDGLISISLNGGIVMEFRKVNVEGPESKKLVYLPPRSLLLMSGAARYDWEHMIVTRRTDTVNGIVLPRQLRVSLTLRTALTEEGQPLPLVSSSSFPPRWGSALDQIQNPLRTPDCERDHVHRVYDAIAEQWHHTRGRRGVLWPGATQFLQRLPPGSVVADIGCGDGKYFPAIWEAGSYVIGTDISLPLLKAAASQGDNEDMIPESRRVGFERQHLRQRPAVAVADCMNVPMRTDSFDAAICIAVLHHLSTPSRRIRCIEELARIVKPGGPIHIQAWALDQVESSRHKFASNDVFVPFNAQPKYLRMGGADEASSEAENGTNGAKETERIKSTAERYSDTFNAEYDDQKGLVVFQRYCHLYKAGELEALCAQVPGVTIVESGFESGNYFVILEAV